MEKNLVERTLLFLLILFVEQGKAYYIFQLALHRWTNPMRWRSGHSCCDSTEPPLACTGYCDTRFEICIQPFSYSASEINCPYGRYDTQDDETLPDTDNITFPFGISIVGNVPNPMTFTVPDPISDSLKVYIAAYDVDQPRNEDDLIDTFKFGMQSINTSNSFVMLPGVRGQYNVGTLVISYRAQCIEGYCGPDCTLRNCNEPTSTSDMITATSTVLLTRSSTVLLTTSSTVLLTSTVLLNTSSSSKSGPLSQVQFYSILSTLGLLLICIAMLIILCISIAILFLYKGKKQKKNDNSIVQLDEPKILTNKFSDSELQINTSYNISSFPPSPTHPHNQNPEPAFSPDHDYDYMSSARSTSPLPPLPPKSGNSGLPSYSSLGIPPSHGTTQYGATS